MAWYEVLAGTIEQFLHLGGPNGPGVKNDAGVIAARNAADSAYVPMRAARPTTNDYVAAEIDVKERILLVTDSFAAAGSFPALACYAMATSTGGIYTEGVVYAAPGGAGAPVALNTTEYVGLTIATAVPVPLSTLTPLIANAIYVLQTIPNVWSMKGSASGISAGQAQTVRVPVPESPGNHDSGFVLPANAWITNVVLDVTNGFIDPLATVKVQIGTGGGAEEVMATGENVPQAVAAYEKKQYTQTVAGGVVRAIVTCAAPDAGEAYAYVTFYKSFLT
jgi:hypothetical protein